MTDYSFLRPSKLCEPYILYMDVHLILVLFVSCSEQAFLYFVLTCNFIPLTITEYPTIDCRTHQKVHLRWPFIKCLIGLIFELSKMVGWLADRTLFIIFKHIYILILGFITKCPPRYQSHLEF